jgi:lysozyme family protein
MLSEISDEEYNRFYDSMKFSMKWEGGYVNDPADPGGETKWGISKKAYPDEDIKALTPERAADLYYRDYWKKSGADKLPFPLCAVVLDSAILCGVARATRWWRESEGDEVAVINFRRTFHVDRVKHSPSQRRFLAGWLNRCNDLLKLVEITKKAP